MKPNLNHQPEEPSPCKIPGIKSWWRHIETPRKLKSWTSHFLVVKKHMVKDQNRCFFCQLQMLFLASSGLPWNPTSSGPCIAPWAPMGRTRLVLRPWDRTSRHPPAICDFSHSCLQRLANDEKPGTKSLSHVGEHPEESQVEISNSVG